MTETNEQKPEPKNEETPPPASEQDHGPAALRRALAKQAAEFKAQIAELAAFKSSTEKASKDKADADALAAGEFQKLIDAEKGRADDLAKQIEKQQRALLTRDAGDALRSQGPIDALRLKGLLAELPGDIAADAVVEWAEAQRKAYPDAFVAKLDPVRQPRAGDPANGSTTGADLRSRLNSTDPYTRRQAASEEASKIARGELAEGWDRK